MELGKSFVASHIYPTLQKVPPRLQQSLEDFLNILAKSYTGDNRELKQRENYRYYVSAKFIRIMVNGSEYFKISRGSENIYESRKLKHRGPFETVTRIIDVSKKGQKITWNGKDRIYIGNMKPGTGKSYLRRSYRPTPNMLPIPFQESLEEFLDILAESYAENCPEFKKRENYQYSISASGKWIWIILFKRLPCFKISIQSGEIYEKVERAHPSPFGTMSHIIAASKLGKKITWDGNCRIYVSNPRICECCSREESGDVPLENFRKVLLCKDCREPDTRRLIHETLLKVPA